MSLFKPKYIPNAISITRGLLVLSLIFIEPLSTACIIIFTIAGFTDMFDGALARRIKDAKSELGATLDSVADLLMYIVGIFVIMPAMEIWPILRVFILIAISSKFLCLIPALIKHRQVFFTHTVLSKIFSLAIFFVAVLYLFLHFFGVLTAAWILAINLTFIFLITYAFAIIIEEMIIISMIDYPEKNIKGFWDIKRTNEEYRRR
jgi:CDP-diacylglycerol--glycerol-3-phosphate 3-phosphatidyltransferase